MKHLKISSKNEFNQWAQNYDESLLQKFLFRPAHRLIMREIDTTKIASILDVGCGTGVFAFKMATIMPSESRIYGIDLSEQMVRETKAKLEYNAFHKEKCIKIKVGDSERLPYSDSTFDYITCSNSFHHYPEQEKVVREMHRVSKDGGKILIVDGDKDRWLGKLIYDVIVVFMEGKVKHLSKPDFRVLLAKSGIENITHRRNWFGLPLLLTVGIVRK